MSEPKYEMIYTRHDLLMIGIGRDESKAEIARLKAALEHIKNCGFKGDAPYCNVCAHNAEVARKAIERTT